jgi:hypothetical protein
MERAARAYNMTSDERVEFERWATSIGFGTERRPTTFSNSEDRNSRYDSNATWIAWQAWEACAEMRPTDETTEPLGLWDHEPTPEMIMAGVHVWGRNERASTADDVRAIYIAMRRLEGRNAEEPEPERHPGANAFSDLGPKKRLVDYACGCSFWRDEGEPDGRCETHQRSAVNGGEKHGD